MDDAHAPEIMSGQLNVVKKYLKARYRLSDLLRAQRNDRMTSNLKRWIENGAPVKGDLEEDSYKILKQFYLKRKDLLCLNKYGIVACKHKEEDKVLYKYNLIVLHSYTRPNCSSVDMIRWAIKAWTKCTTGYRNDSNGLV